MKTQRPPRIATAARRGSLVITVLQFCRLLRHCGLRLSGDGAQVALAALAEIDITRRLDFRTALQVALLKRPEDIQYFNYLFNAYWRLDGDEVVNPSEAANEQPTAPLEAETADDPNGESDDGYEFERMAPEIRPSHDEIQYFLPVAQTGLQSGHSSVGRADFEQAELERLVRALARQLANRRTRRLAPHRGGKLLDLRRVLRQSLRYGGVPVELRWRRPQVARAKLLVFCDVSRSMHEYTALFLHFAYAVLRRVWQVEVFLFATELIRVTDLWLDQPWSALPTLVPACGGGTQIGACLERFLRDYDRSLSGAHTFTLILSDGLDAGEPAAIERAMDSLRRQSHALIWLNPLLGIEGYEPTARGMAAALKHVDVFAPAHDLASLWQLVSTLPAWRGGGRGAASEI